MLFRFGHETDKVQEDAPQESHFPTQESHFPSQEINFPPQESHFPSQESHFPVIIASEKQSDDHFNEIKVARKSSIKIEVPTNEQSILEGKVKIK